jgi:hypothetical protein
VAADFGDQTGFQRQVEDANLPLFQRGFDVLRGLKLLIGELRMAMQMVAKILQEGCQRLMFLGIVRSGMSNSCWRLLFQPAGVLCFIEHFFHIQRDVAFAEVGCIHRDEPQPAVKIAQPRMADRGAERTGGRF